MKYLLLFFLLFSKTTKGQQSFVSVYKAHRFACDKESTTLDVNLCSREKADFADSLLNRLYIKITKSLDKEISQHTLAYAIKQKAKVDSSYKSFLDNERRYYTTLKQKLVSSQQTWLKMREANYTLATQICEGGTGCPAIANAIYIDDTLDRIKRLEDLNVL